MTLKGPSRWIAIFETLNKLRQLAIVIGGLRVTQDEIDRSQLKHAIAFKSKNIHMKEETIAEINKISNP